MSVSGASIVGRIGSEIDKQGLKKAELYKIVPSGTLSNWKNQGQGPNAYTLYKASVFLGVSVDYLLTGKKLLRSDRRRKTAIGLFPLISKPRR